MTQIIIIVREGLLERECVRARARVCASAVVYVRVGACVRAFARVCLTAIYIRTSKYITCSAR